MASNGELQTKGWMQTALVLVRGMPQLFSELGIKRSCALVLLLVNLVVGPLLFPFLSGYVAYRFARTGLSSPSTLWEFVEATIEAIVVMLGLGSTFWCAYIGARARKLDAFLTSIPLMLPYQLMISWAAWLGLVDLILRPHHWHKTEHAARCGKDASERGTPTS